MARQKRDKVTRGGASQKQQQTVIVNVGAKRGRRKRSAPKGKQKADRRATSEATSERKAQPILMPAFTTPIINYPPGFGYTPAPVGVPQTSFGAVPQTASAPAPVGVKVPAAPSVQSVREPLALAALPRGAASAVSARAFGSSGFAARSTEIAIPPRREFPADPRALSGEEPRIQRDVFVPPPVDVRALRQKKFAFPEGETAAALNLDPANAVPLSFGAEALLAPPIAEALRRSSSEAPVGEAFPEGETAHALSLDPAQSLRLTFAEEPRVRFAGVEEAQLEAAAAALPTAPEEEGLFSSPSLSSASSITEAYEPLEPPPEPAQKRAQIVDTAAELLGMGAEDLRAQRASDELRRGEAASAVGARSAAEELPAPPFTFTQPPPAILTAEEVKRLNESEKRKAQRAASRAKKKALSQLELQTAAFEEQTPAELASGALAPVGSTSSPIQFLSAPSEFALPISELVGAPRGGGSITSEGSLTLATPSTGGWGRLPPLEGKAPTSFASSVNVPPLATEKRGTLERRRSEPSKPLATAGITFVGGGTEV
jgi:hypothetical protein